MVVDITERKAIDMKDAAAQLHISLPTLRKAIRRGEIPVIRYGRRVIIPIYGFQKYLERAGQPANT
jgi:excisionase family DNA binding protein